MISQDVLVVGGGLAGLAAALSSDPQLKVAVISKVHPLRSHSVAAQGGINAALGNTPDGKDDTWESHAFDTIKGSDYLADQDVAELMCERAIPAIYELEHLGVPFSRFPGGVIAQRPFGGAGFPRTCYAADRTGLVILHTLYEHSIRKNVKFYNEWFVTKLVVDNEICGMAYRLIQGISQRDDPIALDLFEDLSDEAHFLSMPHTRKWFRQEHTYPRLVDRDPYETWVAAGEKSITARARDEVENLLKSNPPPLPDKEMQKTLTEIMESEAKKNNTPPLPEIRYSR